MIHAQNPWRPYLCFLSSVDFFSSSITCCTWDMRATLHAYAHEEASSGWEDFKCYSTRERKYMPGWLFFFNISFCNSVTSYSTSCEAWTILVEIFLQTRLGWERKAMGEWYIVCSFRSHRGLYWHNMLIKGIIFLDKESFKNS